MRMNRLIAVVLLSAPFGLYAQVTGFQIGHRGDVDEQNGGGRGGLLYDQRDGGFGDSIASQEFGVATDPLVANLTCRGADDFTVPGGIGGWAIDAVFVDGNFFSFPVVPPTPDNFNIFIYADAGGAPGSLVASPVVPYGTVTVTPMAGFDAFEIPLPSAVFLPPGTYWIAVQADLDFCADPACSAVNGQWGWREAGAVGTPTAPYGGSSPSVWQNPGGGWASIGAATGACASFGQRLATCGVGNDPMVFNMPFGPDFAFGVDGQEILCSITGIDVQPGRILVFGTPGCEVDIYYSANCDLTLVDPGVNATYVGTVILDATGVGTLTTTIVNDVCYHVTFVGGGPVLVSSIRSVPTLGQWTFALFALALLATGVVFMRRRSAQA